MGVGGEVRQVKLYSRLASEFQLRNKMSLFSGFSHSKCVFSHLCEYIVIQLLFLKVIFCAFIKVFFYPFQFFPTRGVNRNLFYLRLVRAVFERKSMVNAATGIIDHGAYKNFCRTASKSLGFFLRKQKVFTPGNRAEISNLEVICSMNM